MARLQAASMPGTRQASAHMPSSAIERQPGSARGLAVCLHTPPQALYSDGLPALSASSLLLPFHAILLA